MVLTRKKSLLLALAFAVNLFTVSAIFASEEVDMTDEETDGENWSLTVPAKLEPGQTGYVTLSGSWGDGQQVSVEADSSVTLESDLGDSRTLGVYFDDISVSGSEGSSVFETHAIEIEDMNSLFGEWSGKFSYRINISEAMTEEPELEEVFEDAELEEVDEDLGEDELEDGEVIEDAENGEAPDEEVTGEDGVIDSNEDVNTDSENENTDNDNEETNSPITDGVEDVDNETVTDKDGPASPSDNTESTEDSASDVAEEEVEVPEQTAEPTVEENSEAI